MLSCWSTSLQCEGQFPRCLHGQSGYTHFKMISLLQVIYAVSILQISKPLGVDASAEIFDNQSTFRCLSNLGFPKGAEERVFKTIECENNASVRAGCSSEIVQNIEHLNFSKSADGPEDFIYFVDTFISVWKVLMDGHISENATLCWDVTAMDRMVKDFEFLERYYISNAKYITAVVVFEIIFGLVANSLVMFIILRHKEMRTQPNMMILNLVVADILLIAGACFGNIIVYFYPVSALVFGYCRAIVFAINFASFGSVYSMVSITILRFVAVSAAPGSKTLYIKRKLLKTPVIIFSVWLMSSLAGIPFVLDSNENCMSQFNAGLLSFGFIFFLIVPFVIATGLSIATTKRLKQSAKDMPGNGQDSEKWAREKGARVIIVLIFAFILTYVPPVLLGIVSTQIDFDNNYSRYVFRIITLLNTCINPVGLIISSRAFRKYLKMMLPSANVTCGRWF